MGMADAIFLFTGRLDNGQRLRRSVVGSGRRQVKEQLSGHPVGWWLPMQVSQGLPEAEVKVHLSPSSGHQALPSGQ